MAFLALSALSPRAASAEEGCVRLKAPADLSPAWADALRDLSAQLAGLAPTECRPVTLRVVPAEGGMRIVAEADDGRRAERSVVQPSLLVPIALGLVISIPPEEAAAVSPPESVNPAPPPPVVVPVPSRTASRPNVASAPRDAGASAHAVSFWLGVALGARFGVPSSVSMVDIEARADLRIDRLLLFTSFQNVPIGLVASQGLDGDAYRESSVAFGVGRSFPFGSWVLDLALAPSLVTMRMGLDAPVHARANDVELRVGASARLERSTLGELAPHADRRQRHHPRRSAQRDSSRSLARLSRVDQRASHRSFRSRLMTSSPRNVARLRPRDRSVSRTDPELMRGVADGDLGCLGDLYDRHAQGVWRAVRRALADSADVEDVVHATFLNLPRIASSYDGRPDCGGWLSGIAVRLSMRHSRGAGRFRRMLASFAHVATVRSTSNPERTASHHEDAILLERALGTLTMKKRAVFVLVELEGLSSEEAARALEIPAATVRTRLLHARRELHAALQRGSPS